MAQSLAMRPGLKKYVSQLSVVISLAAVVWLGACAGDGGEIAKPTPPPPPLSMFTDIPLPPELTINEKDSLVIEHEFGRVGLMKTSGRLDQNSALDFFRTHMAFSGWLKTSEFDNGQSHMMIFNKEQRSAAITVTEGWVITDVEINVSAQIQP